MRVLPRRLELPADAAPVLELLCAADGRRHEDRPGDALLRARARSWRPARGALGVSRAYCFPYALVGWHTSRVGVGIERVLTRDETFARSICTPAELAQRPWEEGPSIISLWSAKQALARALGEPLSYDPRRLESPSGWPAGASGPWRAQPVPVPAGYCAWVCWRA